MDAYTATGLAEGFIEGTEEEQIEAWQHLENTGLAYQLQGFFGRTCQSLISQGVITPRVGIGTDRKGHPIHTARR